MWLVAIASDQEFSHFYFREPLTRERGRLAACKHSCTLGERSELDVTCDWTLIGTVRLDLDAENTTAVLAYGISRAYWGRGLTTEAAQAMVSYVFEVFDIAKIWAHADPRNIGSVRILEKLGMRPMAFLRSHVVRRGDRADRVYYGCSDQRV
jgi:ribosomal-protein-alanine N-acetyltransferase